MTFVITLPGKNASVRLPEFAFITPSVFYSEADSFLSALANMINEDDSYNQIPKPDRSRFKTERLTDKNFTVSTYKIKW